VSVLFRSERGDGPSVRGCVWAAAELVCAKRPALRSEIVEDAGDRAGLLAEVEDCYRRQPDMRSSPVDHVELARRYLAERDARHGTGPPSGA
jgi:hypothetical protein